MSTHNTSVIEPNIYAAIQGREEPAPPTVAEAPCCNAAQNVGDVERVISATAGGLLCTIGLTHGSLSGLLLAGLGGALIYRGATGHCSLYQAMNVSTHRGDASNQDMPAKG